MTAATVPTDCDSADPAVAGVASMRRHCVSTRVSPVELAAWQTAAGGHQLGRWVRGVVNDRLTGGPDTELLIAVNRLGVNLNQMARRLRCGQQANPATLSTVLAAEGQLRWLSEAILARGGPTLTTPAGPAVAGVASMRRHCVATRVSPAELVAWQTAAGSHQLGRWLRGVVNYRLTGGPDPELLAAINTLGVTVNQMARRLNYGEQANAAMRSTMEAAEAQLLGWRKAVPAGAGLSVPAPIIGAW